MHFVTCITTQGCHLWQESCVAPGADKPRWAPQELTGTKSVGGGRAFSVCRCGAEELEGVERCVFTQELATSRVVCDDGYALTVRTPAGILPLNAQHSFHPSSENRIFMHIVRRIYARR